MSHLNTVLNSMAVQPLVNFAYHLITCLWRSRLAAEALCTASVSFKSDRPPACVRRSRRCWRARHWRWRPQAAAAEGREQALTPAARQLLRCLAITATGNPVAALRNAAFLALDAVLSALQVGIACFDQGGKG